MSAFGGQADFKIDPYRNLLANLNTAIDFKGNLFRAWQRAGIPYAKTFVELPPPAVSP